jgi:hypothetical protein
VGDPSEAKQSERISFPAKDDEDNCRGGNTICASQSYPSSTSIKRISNLLQTITSLRCSSETGRWRPDVVTQYGSRTRLKAWPTAPPFLAVARTKAAINVERANVDATSK